MSVDWFSSSGTDRYCICVCICISLRIVSISSGIICGAPKFLLTVLLICHWQRFLDLSSFVCFSLPAKVVKVEKITSNYSSSLHECNKRQKTIWIDGSLNQLECKIKPWHQSINKSYIWWRLLGFHSHSYILCIFLIWRWNDQVSLPPATNWTNWQKTKLPKIETSPPLISLTPPRHQQAEKVRDSLGVGIWVRSGSYQNKHEEEQGWMHTSGVTPGWQEFFRDWGKKMLKSD